jgi:ferredoxin
MFRFFIGRSRFLHKLPRSYCQSRRIFQTSKEYLQSQGYSAQEAEAMLNAFPSGINTSIGELKSWNKVALDSLAEAVRRTLPTSITEHIENITITLKIPHEHREIKLQVAEGKSFHDISLENHEVQKYLECSCRGIAACSTCHIIVDETYFKKLPPPAIEELDMLDLAWGNCDQSRLGCQITLTKDLEGFTATIPAQSNNLFN